MSVMKQMGVPYLRQKSGECGEYPPEINQMIHHHAQLLAYYFTEKGIRLAFKING